VPLSVFISSTSLDLKDHRIAVERSLLNAGLHPIGMEHFAAQPQEPLQACLNEIRDANLFIGVYGWRYGFVPGQTGASITELEFSEAQRLGRPCFCFFVDPGFPWPEALRDKGDAAVRLEMFKQRVDAIVVRSTFTTPDDLAARVLASIQRFERAQPRKDAQSAAQTPEQRSLTTLLERGKQFWVAGVLANVAGGTGTYSLPMHSVPNAVDQHWREGTTFDSRTHQDFGQGLTILDIFERAGRLLLILGDPGSGKTVTLLQLAERLIEQARSISSESVPVIFHLGSWAEQHLPLEKWLVLEAKSKYYVSGELFEKWLREQRIILLLDGLDEVAISQQDACVQSINTFAGSLGVPGIAICARREEYLSLPTKLRLNEAVNISELSTDQIHAILSSSNESMQNLLHLVKTAPEMAALAGSPLMLNLMQATVSGSRSDSALDLPNLNTNSPADAVVAHYIDDRLALGKFDLTRRQAILDRLGWIAKRIVDRGGSLFQVDSLQPSHLGSLMRVWYWILSRTAVGFVLGVTEGTYLSFMTSPNVSFFTSLAKGALVGLLFGAGAGLIEMYWRDRLSHKLHQQDQEKPPRSQVLIFIALLFALFATLNWTIWNSWLRTGFGVVWALLFALRSAGGGLGQEIRTPEIRAWSWRSAAKGFVIGCGIGCGIGGFIAVVAMGALDAAGAGISTKISFVIASTAFYGIVGAVFMGWRENTIATRVRANEGIRLFIRNMLRGGTALGVATGGIWLLAVMVLGLVAITNKLAPDLVATVATAVATYGQVIGMGIVTIALTLAGLIIGLVVGSYFAVIGALWYGGIDVINHYVLRMLLWISGQTPLRLIRWLDEAVEIRLLRRIGSGYAFIHRTLLEHFAARDLTSKRA
jgi:hypothetical protein